MTGAGTLAREASVLGKPAFSFYSGSKLLAVDRKLIDEGKMIFSRDPKYLCSIVANIYFMKNHNDSSIASTNKAREDIFKILNSFIKYD